MNNPSASTGDDCGKYRLNGGDKSKTLLRLRHQSRLAAILLFCPWVLTIVFWRPIVSLKPMAILTFLPGLAIAIHLHRQLSGHLTANHRHHEEDRLFPTLGTANWITLLRAGAIVALSGFLPMAFLQGHETRYHLNWAPGIIYLGISLADLFDGFVARWQRHETKLGKRLDIETDAAGLLVASLLAVVLGRLPAVYLLVGLAYYPFVLGIRIRQRRSLPLIALQSRPSARIIAGFQMGLVTAALLPIFNPAFTSIAAGIFMLPLLIGFFRDWLVVSCRIKTDADQQSSLDLRARSLMRRALPWTLRPVLLAGEIMMLVSSAPYRTHLTWHQALSLCSLMAALGIMGRSASLFLVLLLGCSQSPFGMSWPAIVVFCAAAALMLTGTGAMSLWTPEDDILYRRKKEKQ
jgi:CDP-diacylglycerol---glycerol-3-phosphate 3-phosphatidyltransferase